MSRHRLMRLRVFVVLLSVTAAGSTLRASTIDDVLSDMEVPWLSPVAAKPQPGKDAGEKAVGEKSGREKEGAEGEEFETDRDSYTPSTTTVATGRVLVESAYSFINNRKVPDSHSFPELITRYGLTKNLEFRLGWNYEVGGGGDVSNGNAGGELEEPGVKRDAQILYGFKYVLTRQKSWLPESVVIVQGATPTAGQEGTGRAIINYVFGWTIFEKCKLDSAIRYENMKEEGDHFNQWSPSVVLKVPVFERCNLHGEYFGIFTDGRTVNTNAQYLSPGISYLVTPTCEVGVRFGWGMNQDAASFFSNVGFGLMF